MDNNNNNNDMQSDVSVEEILAYSENQEKVSQGISEETKIPDSSNMQNLSEEEAKQMISLINMSGGVRDEQALQRKLMTIPFDKVGKSLLRKFYTDAMSREPVRSVEMEEYEDFKRFLAEKKSDIGKAKSLIAAFFGSTPNDFKSALYSTMPDFAKKLFEQDQGYVKPVDMDYDTIKTLGRDFLGIDKEEGEDDFQYSEKVKNMFDKFASVMASKIPYKSMNEDALVGKIASTIEERVMKKVMETGYKKDYNMAKGGDSEVINKSYNNNMQNNDADQESMIIMTLQVDKNLSDKEAEMIKNLARRDNRYMTAHNLLKIDGGEALEKVIMEAYDKYDLYKKGNSRSTSSPNSSPRQSNNGGQKSLLERIKELTG